MLQRKLTGTLEPGMIWWALQNRSGRSWKRITTVYERILILYTKKWATNSTKQLKKWVSERVATGGKWGRDCGADGTLTMFKTSWSRRNSSWLFGEEEEGTFSNTLHKNMNPLRGPGRVYSTAHEASLKLHSSDHFSTRWALRSAPQSAFLPPFLYNTQRHSRFNSLEERSGTNSRSKGGGQLGSSPYGRNRTQVIFLHETCQKGLDIQIPSSAHIRIAGEEGEQPWYQALLMLKGSRKMRIKKADMQLRKERVSQ